MRDGGCRSICRHHVGDAEEQIRYGDRSRRASKQLGVTMVDYHSILDIIAIVGFIITLVGIVYQFADSKNQKLQLNDMAKSMSTRFVGVFPRNLSEIIDLIDRAQSSLDIMVDICAYGQYSNVEQF